MSESCAKTNESRHGRESSVCFRDCYTDEKRKELAAKRRELNKIKKRIAEIDDLILKIYEDNVSHKIALSRAVVIITLDLQEPPVRV